MEEPHPFSSRFTHELLQRDHFPPVEEAFLAYTGPSHYLPIHTPRPASLDRSLTGITPMTFSGPLSVHDFLAPSLQNDSSSSATPLRVLERAAVSPSPAHLPRSALLTSPMPSCPPLPSPSMRLLFTSPQGQTYHQSPIRTTIATQTEPQSSKGIAVTAATQTPLEWGTGDSDNNPSTVEVLLENVLRELVLAREDRESSPSLQHLKEKRDPQEDVVASSTQYYQGPPIVTHSCCTCTMDWHQGLVWNRMMSPYNTLEGCSSRTPLRSIASSPFRPLRYERNRFSPQTRRGGLSWSPLSSSF